MSNGKKGVVDFVLLLDASGSMGKCMEALKASLSTFLGDLTGPQSIIRDWRGKVVTYCDATQDRSGWFGDNPFVSDAGQLAAQLAAVEVGGGGDEPESLLDALHKLATTEMTPKDAQSFDPNKWRGRCTRCVVAFTDATYHPTMSYEGGAGGGLMDVANAMMAAKIVLIGYVPEAGCYDDLSAIDKSEFEKLPGPDFVASMNAVAGDPTKFTRVMKQFAKTLSASAATEAL